ncbi:hypothetical protein E4K10_00920 [Streptomyces sp. T1317-0309]|nr:hypothetical protein E4K10_00920 [Streptomyces sp. T1317-0309]
MTTTGTDAGGVLTGLGHGTHTRPSAGLGVAALRESKGLYLGLLALLYRLRRGEPADEAREECTRPDQPDQPALGGPNEGRG